MRTHTRGPSGSGAPLETVQESSLPSTPVIGAARPLDKNNRGHDRPERIEENPMEEAFARDHKSKPESGNESSGGKSLGRKSGDEAKEGWKPTSTRASSKLPAIHSKKSYTNLPGKLKTTSEGSVKNMTVETETVSSIPQVAVGGGTGERSVPGRSDTGSSLRMKESTETIRPKKDKKKVLRKTTSLNAGTASSKADIFERKVATAVGEADSSDSEETFVYESNPPEPLSARTHEFHSRTPSTASTLSQIDPYGTKGRQESQQNIVRKKSMKFTTAYNTINHAHESEGTVRGLSQGSRSGTPHHHHIGRLGRGGHASIFDKESPFPNDAKTPRTAAAQLQQFSARHSRQSSQATRFNGNPRKVEEPYSYDLEGEGADDERAPLMGSVRSGRNRRRPLPGSVRQMYANDNREHRSCGRLTAFASLGSILALLIAAIVIVLVLCTKPLCDVVVQDIRNVLASESEIMLDLQVGAVNPNIIAITVTDVDLNVFAKSRHVGTSLPSHTEASVPRNQFSGRPPKESTTSNPSKSPLRTGQDLQVHFDGIDEGNDPMPFPEDPASDSQTMLLGRIFTFDSPLIFEASPIHRRSLSSTGEVRLSRPGNKTEEGGSKRWERVLQHDFELIVRGVVKYSLPITSKMRSASIGGKVVVHPTEEDSEGNQGGLRLSRPRPKQGADNGSNVIIEPPPIRTLEMLKSRLRRAIPAGYGIRTI